MSSINKSFSKVKKNFICQECGSVSTKWVGKCNDCGSWNSLIEEVSNSFVPESSGNKLEITDLSYESTEIKRIKIGIEELDRVLGGGMVKGSVILIGGDPGIGKSTILLQSMNFLSKNHSVLYVSGEESIEQIKIRAKRLGLQKSKVKLTNSNNILDIISTVDLPDPPSVLVIDSIQTMSLDCINSSTGTISQIKACTDTLTSFAKKKGIILLIVSHVTKEGQIAGPKLLEHMVDTVLYFEGEKNNQFRLLRAVKNRYGATNEIGVFEMNDTGLFEVTNPSELFLSIRDNNISGTSIFAAIEGTRAILVEIQVLIASSYMPAPRRSVVGWDINRLSMIIAVLNSRLKIDLSNKEVYLTIVGGIKIVEPAADLSVICALISAYKNIPLSNDMIIIGEVGLSGEIRMTSNIDIRLKEAIKLGFKKAIIPFGITKLKNFSNIKKSFSDMNISYVKHIKDIIRIIS